MFFLLPPIYHVKKNIKWWQKPLQFTSGAVICQVHLSWPSGHESVSFCNPFALQNPALWKLLFQRSVQYKKSSFCRRETINEKHTPKMQIPISYLHRCHIKKPQIIVRNISIDFSCYILSSSVDWNFTVNSFANFCCRQLIHCNVQLASLLL